MLSIFKVCFSLFDSVDVFSAASRFATSQSSNLSVIVIDNIDGICTKRSEYDQENTQIVSQLLTCIDGLKTTNRILVLATTTRPYVLDSALRRAGRFDKEVALLPPTQDQRKAILEYYFKQYDLHQTVHSFIPELSLLTRGYSGADIEMFVRNAVLSAIQQSLSQDHPSYHASLTPSLLLSVLASIRPSIMKDQEQVTGISWEAIGGMNEIKTQLHQVGVSVTCHVVCGMADRS